MTNWYSEHFSEDAVLVTGTTTGAITPDNPPIFAPPGLAHAPRRVKRSLVDFTLGDAPTDIPENSTCRMFSCKSSDRIYKMLTSAAAASWTAATNLDIGVYLSDGPELNHDGALLDINLFGSLLDIGNGFANVDHFSAGALEDEDRGKQMWELVEEGATQSWTEDPFLDFDIVIELSTTGGASGELLLIMEYTAGMG